MNDSETGEGYFAQVVREIGDDFYEKAAAAVVNDPGWRSRAADKLLRSERLLRAEKAGTLDMGMVKEELLEILENDGEIREAAMDAFRKYVARSP